MYKALNSTVIFGVDLIQVEGIKDVCPHVVIMLNVILETIGPTLKFVVIQTTDEAFCHLIFFNFVLWNKAYVY